MIANNPFDAEMLQGIYELVLETVVCQRDTIVIEGTSYPISIVKSKFMRLNSSHVEYVMDSLKCTTSKIRNIKKYLFACLFNAPPVLLIVGVARLLVSLATKVYGFVSFWFWVLLAIITVMTVLYHKWDQTVIMVVLGAVSLAVLFGAVWVQVTLEDISSFLERKIIS